MGSAQSKSDINIFDTYRTEMAKFGNEFPFLNLKIVQKDVFDNMENVIDAVENMFYENSYIMKEYIKNVVPDGERETLPMVYSLESSLRSYKYDPDAKTEEIKRMSIGLIMPLIKRVVIRLYNIPLSENTKRVRLSYDLEQYLKIIETLSMHYSGSSEKVNFASIPVDDEVFKRYVQMRPCPFEKFADETEKILGMTLTKVGDYPILVRYVHLMASMISMARLYTKPETIYVGGNKSVHGGVWWWLPSWFRRTHRQRDNLENPEHDVVAFADDDEYMFDDEYMSDYVDRSDRKEGVYAVEEEKPTRYDDRSAFRKSLDEGMIGVLISLMVFTGGICLGAHSIKNFNKVINEGSDTEIIGYTFAGLTSILFIVFPVMYITRMALLKRKNDMHYSSNVVAMGGRKIINDPESESVNDKFTKSPIMAVEIEETTPTISQEFAKIFNQKVMDIYKVNSDLIQKYANDSSEEVDKSLSNVFAEVTTEITARPEIEYDSNDVPKITPLLDKAVKLMAKSILLKLSSKDPSGDMEISEQDRVLLNSLNYISSKIITKTHMMPPAVAMTNEEVIKFLKSGDVYSPEASYKLVFICDKVMNHYRDYPIIVNYAGMVRSMLISLESAKTGGGTKLLVIMGMFLFFIMSLITFGVTYYYWKTNPTPAYDAARATDLSKNVQGLFGNTKLFADWIDSIDNYIKGKGEKKLPDESPCIVDAEEAHGGLAPVIGAGLALGGDDNIHLLAAIKNIMIIVIIVATILLIYLVCKVYGYSRKSIHYPLVCSHT